MAVTSTIEATLTRIGLRGSTTSNFIPTRNPGAGRILKARAGTGRDVVVVKYESQEKSEPGRRRSRRGMKRRGKDLEEVKTRGSGGGGTGGGVRMRSIEVEKELEQNVLHGEKMEGEEKKKEGKSRGGKKAMRKKVHGPPKHLCLTDMALALKVTAEKVESG